MTGARPTVLVTGADGSVGRRLVPQIREPYDLRLHAQAQRPSDPDLDRYPWVYGDITDADQVAEMFSGVDVVIHLAAASKAQASWDQVRGPNIDGVYNIFEQAVRAGVERVIFASSNHVVGMHRVSGSELIQPDVPVRPDGPYGVSKAFGEVLGRYYADTFGLSVVCLRIGWVLDEPFNEQGLKMWLSPRDLGQLINCSLDADVGFGIYFGASANSRCPWDLSNARSDLGYMPADDSEVFAKHLGTNLE